MLDALVWFFKNIALAFYNFGYAITHPGSWLAWLGEVGGPLTSEEAKQSLMRFIYYGASVEFFFVIMTAFLVLTAAGLWRNKIMWGYVRGLECFANVVGRFFAWAGLLMVLQQIIIVFLQRVFRVSEISIGPTSPFGYKLYDTLAVTFDLSWWAEELKLYNAMVVALCCAYTFIQSGHVRVDLVYSGVSYRTKKLIDMVGSIVFMMPFAVLVWLYGWFFMWRVLVVPNTSASDGLDRLLLKSRALRWNVETIGFSPNGFNAYFLFKVLLLAFVVMIFLQAVAFFFRSYLERKEGEVSEGKYLDKDASGETDAGHTAPSH